VQENGKAAGYSSGVKEIAYVNGTIWQENTSNLWWNWSGTTWAGGSGVAVNPLISANKTVVTATTKSSIIDAKLNTWTISNGAVQENGTAAGYSAGVKEIAYVNGTIWQENTANLWWSWSGTAWAGGAGIATSPVA
jgi:hypothetical protein